MVRMATTPHGHTHHRAFIPDLPRPAEILQLLPVLKGHMSDNRDPRRRFILRLCPFSCCWVLLWPPCANYTIPAPRVGHCSLPGGLDAPSAGGDIIIQSAMHPPEPPPPVVRLLVVKAALQQLDTI
jgi:hypothetical protein